MKRLSLTLSLSLFYLQTEAIKHDLETKMSHHRLEQQIERAQYNQTAVMLMIENCALIRDNTSRAVTSLDNMVLYFMKAKGSENDTSLMGLLQVSSHKARRRSRTSRSAISHALLTNQLHFVSCFDSFPVGRTVRVLPMAGHFGLPYSAADALLHPDYWRGSAFTLCPDILQCLRTLLYHTLLAIVRCLSGLLGGRRRFLYAAT